MIKKKDNFAYFSIKTENVGTRYKSQHFKEIS